MISQVIQDQLSDISLDVTTVAGLAFAAFLVIYFFAKIKPAIDSKSRVRRQVRFMIERDKALAIYRRSSSNKITPQKYNKTKAFKPSYSSFAKRNSHKIVRAQLIKHSAFKSFSNSRHLRTFNHA